MAKCGDQPTRYGHREHALVADYAFDETTRVVRSYVQVVPGVARIPAEGGVDPKSAGSDETL
jgi:hypothetical protein